MQRSPFETYGGYATVRRIVLAMYDRLLEDDMIGAFFNEADMPNLVDHQTLFVATIMGGPASFTDKHVADAHRHLHLTDAQFDRLKTIVEATFTDFAIDPSDVGAIVAAFEARRPLLIRWPRVL